MNSEQQPGKGTIVATIAMRWSMVAMVIGFWVIVWQVATTLTAERSRVEAENEAREIFMTQCLRKADEPLCAVLWHSRNKPGSVVVKKPQRFAR